MKAAGNRNNLTEVGIWEDIRAAVVLARGCRVGEASKQKKEKRSTNSILTQRRGWVELRVFDSLVQKDGVSPSPGHGKPGPSPHCPSTQHPPCQELLGKCLQSSVTLLFCCLPEQLLPRGHVGICVSDVSRYTQSCSLLWRRGATLTFLQID